MLNDKTDGQMKTELDLDALASVTGGTGSGGGVDAVDGTVVAKMENAMFSVDVGGQTITASISGKLRMNFVRINVGDRVRVEGRRITYVYR